MQVQLLKKISVLQFVARSVLTNAILRFEADAPFPFVEGAVILVTDCAFANASKIVHCRARAIESPDGSTREPQPPARKRSRPELASA